MFSKNLIFKGYGAFFRTALPAVTRVNDTIKGRTCHQESETAGQQLPVNNIMGILQPKAMMFKNQHTSPTEKDIETACFDSLSTMSMKY